MTDREEGQSVLNDAGFTAKLQTRLEQLNKAVEFIRNRLKNKRNGQFEIQVLEWVNKKAEIELKHKVKKHVIDIAGLNHAVNGHGIGGDKIDRKSIPLTKEDIELAPYILIYPDRISKGTPMYGRESVIYEKGLSNGKIVYIEGLEGDELVSKNMWADLSPQLMSSLAVDARSKERPQAHVLNAIQSIDRAKIIKEAENAIRKEEFLARADKLFVFSDKNVYGFVKNDTIYIDMKEINIETPIHEYAHLWAEALRQQNPKEWKNVVSIMKSLTELWNKVREDYPHLETDDEVADEVLATYNGQHGMQRLREECRNFKDGDTVFRRINAALNHFWENVSNFFGIQYKSAEEVADRVFYDLLNEVNPLVYTKKGVQKLSDRMILGQIKQIDMNMEEVKRQMSGKEVFDRFNKTVNDGLYKGQHANINDIILRADELGIDYHPVGLKGGVSIDVKVFCDGVPDRRREIYGYTSNDDIDLVHFSAQGGRAYDRTFVRVWVEDKQAESPAKIVIQLEQEGYDVDLHGERGRYVDFDSWQEAVAFEQHVRDIEQQVHGQSAGQVHAPQTVLTEDSIRKQVEHFGAEFIGLKSDGIKAAFVVKFKDGDGYYGSKDFSEKYGYKATTNNGDYYEFAVDINRLQQTKAKEVSMTSEESPMMKQFHYLKAKHPDALLLFRVGDFYETYEKDAKTASDILGITLTWKNAGADFNSYKGALAGFPHYALDTYLPKLIRAGQRVDICDQLEDPKKTQQQARSRIIETVVPSAGVKMQVVDRHSSLLPIEKALMSQIVCDLETGNHLLGRKRPEGYWEFAAEHGGAVRALKEGRVLTARQRDILLERADNYYGGIAELAELLNMKEDHLRKALLVDPVREQRAEQNFRLFEEGVFWYVDSRVGFGLNTGYAEEVAEACHGEQAEYDGRIVIRFASRDDAVSFINQVSMLLERHTNALRDGLIDRMRRAGLDVNTNWREGERVLKRANNRLVDDFQIDFQSKVGQSLSFLEAKSLVKKNA